MKYSLAKEINAFVKEKVTCFFCQSIAYHYIKLTGDDKVKKTRRKMNDKEFSGLIRDAIGLALDIHTMSFRDHDAISKAFKNRGKVSEKKFLENVERAWNTPANKLEKR